MFFRKNCEKSRCSLEKVAETEVYIPDDHVSKLRKISSLELFGKERWEYIQKGILKLYGKGPIEKHTAVRSYVDFEYFEKNDNPTIEIPLDHIPGMQEYNKYFFTHWEYASSKNWCAHIYTVDNEEATGMRYLYKWVGVLTPVKYMIEHIERERKKQEEERIRNEERIKGMQDRSIEELLEILKEK